ncbi:MalY/PatB family protein [Clostridium manihotivorum]|uniref:cysteine-S-conjugate beta-lyase n=1 Tax=Clostridium manihotivorum TaxID=2320868 RepID=A0A410DVR5_9CLOT|nr:MalY/PatB family protein [Clostridium manihotivorum]QAA33165.1 cystathionine beta-lyase [Clostridium manihotivorum]
MNYDFDKLIDRRNTNSIKWEFMHEFDKSVSDDTIPLWVADMDFPCAPEIIKALHQRVDKLIFGYSSNDTDRYYKAISSWYNRRFNWNIERQDIFYSPGVVPAIGYLIEILTKPTEGVIIQNPVYHPFAISIRSNNRVVVNNSLINNNGYYEIDFDDLEKKAKDPNNKLLILCSPHNPVGRVWKKEELLKVGKICSDNNVIIISDEIHSDLIRKNIKHTPLEVAFPEYKTGIITATAPSKTFNLAGMQLANIIIHDKEIQDKWKKYVNEKLNISLPTTFAITATEAAYLESEPWLEGLLNYLDENINFLEAFLKNNLPKTKFVKPEGTYLTWIDFSAYGYSNEEFNKLMIEKAKVLLESGTIFGEEGKGYFRVNIACPRALLEEAFNRIAKALNS